MAFALTMAGLIIGVLVLRSLIGVVTWQRQRRIDQAASRAEPVAGSPAPLSERAFS